MKNALTKAIRLLLDNDTLQKTSSGQGRKERLEERLRQGWTEREENEK